MITPFTVAFTEEEMLVLSMNNEDSRKDSIAYIKELLSTSADDSEMQELLEGLLEKLCQISDDDYLQLDLTGYEDWIEDIEVEIDEEISVTPVSAGEA